MEISAILEKLDTKEFGIERVNRVATFEDLIAMAHICQMNHKEYGVLTYKTEKEGKQSVFNNGGNSSIQEPTPLETQRGKVKGGVYFHIHECDQQALDKGVIYPRNVLPSWFSGSILIGGHGDFLANLVNRTIAGYMNIAAEQGLTLNIGVEGASRNDYILHKLKRKVQAKEKAEEEVWKIRSGKANGQAFVNSEIYFLDEDPNADQNAISTIEPTLLTHTSDNGNRHFLFIPWGKDDELRSVIGDLDNLCYGDGLDKLVSHLNLNVVHGKNLDSVARYVWVKPKSRKE